MTPKEFSAAVGSTFDLVTVMLAITKGVQPGPGNIVAAATGSLVTTRQVDMLVTNHHVYEEFRSLQQESPDAALLMSGAHGSRFLDISRARVLGLDKDRDLAVLHVPLPSILGQRKMVFVPPSWPPPRPKPGMLAILYGYPGQGRVDQGQAVGMSPISIGLPVVSASERHFVLIDEEGTADWEIPDGQDPLTSFGGISGSAVYVLPKGAGVTEQEAFLGGFAYEATPSGAILVTYSDHINADGSIR